MIRHVVFVKFRADAVPDAIERFLTEVNKLPLMNREVRNWVTGRTASPRFHSGDFDWALSCDLADAAAMERYMSHEGHLRMIDFLSPVEHMMSYDWEIEYRAPDSDPAAATAAAEPVSPPVPARGPVKVPEIRGQRLERACEMLAAAGVGVADDIESVLGSVWAPGRVLAADPAPGTMVSRETALHLTVTGDWLCAPAKPNEAAPW